MHTNKLFIIALILVALVLGLMAYLIVFRDSGEGGDLTTDSLMKDSEIAAKDTQRTDPAVIKSPEPATADKAGDVPLTHERLAPTEIDVLHHGQVFGQVLDEEKKPIARADVYLYQESAFLSHEGAGAGPHILYQTVSDHQGAFIFNNVPAPGEYTVSSSMEGYLPLNRPTVNVYPKKAQFVPDLIMGQGWDLSGTVKDSDGNPIHGAQIFMEPETENIPSLRWLSETDDMGLSTKADRETTLFLQKISIRRKTSTDEGGQYQIGAIGAGHYRVGAWAQGYGMVINRAVNTDNVTTKKVLKVNFTLESAMTIHGMVRDMDKNPVPGVEIQAELDGNPRRASIARTHSAEENGRFKLTNLVSGSYIVRANKKGYLPEIKTDIQAGETLVIIVMTKTAALSGKVVSADTGKPVKDFSATICANPIRLQGELIPLRPWQSFQSDEGLFTIEGLQRGRYILAVRSENIGSGFSEPLPLQDAESAGPFTIKLEKGFSYKGRVVDGRGKPVAGAQATIMQGRDRSLDLSRFFGHRGEMIQERFPTILPTMPTD
ncbi:MAG: carboxypeptidase-like regulatory domain-containing protein, partial [Planctomycetes bacterium]|nr:carboxypeptidase-like regulatory domain-containing protein [Planctomycetota bacterium]